MSVEDEATGWRLRELSSRSSSSRAGDVIAVSADQPTANRDQVGQFLRLIRGVAGRIA
jgi:hypothetical protein